MARKPKTPQYERLRKALKKAGDAGLTTGEIARKFKTDRPMSIVNELEGHGYEITRRPGALGQGTCVVLGAYKWDTKPNIVNEAGFESAASGPTASGDHNNLAAASPSGDAADSAPTHVIHEFDYTGDEPVHSERTVDGEGADEVHIVLGEELVGRMLAELEHERRLRTGRELVPRLAAAVIDSDRLGYRCKGCGFEHPKPGPCPRCGEEEVAAIAIYSAGSDEPRLIAHLPGSEVESAEPVGAAA